MARYELGAIYKIDAGEKSYYARLLNCDLYGVFEPVSSEISEEAFENTPYHLYISTGAGTAEHQQKQMNNLKKLGCDVLK